MVAVIVKAQHLTSELSVIKSRLRQVRFPGRVKIVGPLVQLKRLDREQVPSVTEVVHGPHKWP